jgi:hypothetical protein
MAHNYTIVLRRLSAKSLQIHPQISFDLQIEWLNSFPVKKYTNITLHLIEIMA